MVRVTIVDVMGDEERATGRDEATSFDALYRSEYAPVVRLAYVLTGRIDLAEEHAQEGFLAAHRHWSKVAGYESPAGWVRRVVVNRCVSTARRRATEVKLLTRLGREPAIIAELDHRTDELWAMVRRLPKRQAQVLALVFLEDRSVPDVAAILDCSEDTVRTHLRRGRLTLAEQIEEARDV